MTFSSSVTHIVHMPLTSSSHFLLNAGRDNEARTSNAAKETRGHFVSALFSNHDYSTVGLAHALLTSAYFCHIVLLLLMIEPQRQQELHCQVVFLTCFSRQWVFFPVSVSDKF